MKYNSPKNKVVTAVVSFACMAAVVCGVGVLTAKDEKKVNPMPTPPPVTAEQPKSQVAEDNSTVTVPEIQAVDSNKNAKPVETAPKQEKETPKQNTSVKPETAPAKPKEEPAKPAPQTSEAEKETEETGNFSDNTALSWPLSGHIVMDYSTDRAIYDVTLDQYRTNDSICIEAAEGTEVRASAAGTVSFVGVDSEKGNTVVVTHKDGWTTTYSQLADGVSVSEGQHVDAGEVLGTVGAPTKYSVLLGSHLDFQVAREDQSIDPKVALAKQ